MKKGILIAAYTIILACLFAMAESNNAQNQKKATEPLGTQEKAVALLNALIKHNAAFSVKIAHQLLPAKVKLWQQRGIFKFPPQVTWDVFKKDVHQFGASLHALLEKDAKGKYYHLDALRKDYPLYKTLESMAQKLIRIRTPNQTETPQKVGRPLQPLIALYATSFYTQKLLATIASFFKKFEVQAKKMREEAEQAQKAAERPSTQNDVTLDYDSYDAGEADFGDIFSDDYDDFGDFGEIDSDFS